MGQRLSAGLVRVGWRLYSDKLGRGWWPWADQFALVWWLWAGQVEVGLCGCHTGNLGLAGFCILATSGMARGYGLAK